MRVIWNLSIEWISSGFFTYFVSVEIWNPKVLKMAKTDPTLTWARKLVCGPIFTIGTDFERKSIYIFINHFLYLLELYQYQISDFTNRLEIKNNIMENCPSIELWRFTLLFWHKNSLFIIFLQILLIIKIPFCKNSFT